MRCKNSNIVARTLDTKSKIALSLKNGNICPMPKCENILVVEDFSKPTIITEFAHIIAYSPDGPRGNPDISMKQLNSLDNFIIVCRNCHKIIDSNPDDFPIVELIKIKKLHEKIMGNRFTKEVTELTFNELEEVLKHLDLNKKSVSSDFKSLKINDKINKNEFSEIVSDIILKSYSQIEIVTKYLKDHAIIDLGDRIRDRFVTEYNQITTKSQNSDDVFFELWAFACYNSSTESFRKAGIALLVYFFESCEVFKK